MAERRARAFGSGKVTPELSLDYLGSVRNNWRDSEASITRSAILLVLLGVVFVLLQRGEISEVSLGFVKLASPESLRFGIAPVFAYVYLTFILTLDISIKLAWVHESVFRRADARALPP
jgi:hypothetical protein